jgi:hypothetical protein
VTFDEAVTELQKGNRITLPDFSLVWFSLLPGPQKLTMHLVDGKPVFAQPVICGYEYDTRAQPFATFSADQIARTDWKLYTEKVVPPKETSLWQRLFK